MAETLTIEIREGQSGTQRPAPVPTLPPPPTVALPPPPGGPTPRTMPGDRATLPVPPVDAPASTATLPAPAVALPSLPAIPPGLPVARRAPEPEYTEVRPIVSQEERESRARRRRVYDQSEQTSRQNSFGQVAQPMLGQLANKGGMAGAAAGMANAGASLGGAMGGPPGMIAQAALELRNKVAEGMRAGVEAVGNAARSAADLDATALAAPIGMLTKYTIFGEAIEQAGKSALEFDRALQGTISRLSSYSAPLATAAAQADVRQILGDIRRAQYLGSDLARYQDMRSQLSDMGQDLMAQVLKGLMPAAEKILAKLIRVVEILEGVPWDRIGALASTAVDAVPAIAGAASTMAPAVAGVPVIGAALTGLVGRILGNQERQIRRDEKPEFDAFVGQFLSADIDRLVSLGRRR